MTDGNKEAVYMKMRLAFRREGEFVNCYLAQHGTLEGSVLLSSMRSAVLEGEQWPAWKLHMQGVLIAIIKSATGIDAFFPPGAERPAPEDERSGSA